MRTVLLCAGIAAGSFAALPAQAASGTSLWPAASDRAICDPIFSRLEKAEQGVLVAQADQPKPPVANASAKDEASDKPDEQELTSQLSAMLQACSYDGKALTVDARALGGSASEDGAAAVTRIMRHTGLPQNFTIMESDVPNAAAIIVMGRDGILKRVIAYSRDFMKRVADAADGNDWSPVSIMAHEIGHHLSGHTLTPGGSQPPIELEADKFSGFVLFKMGAKLADAQKAIETLIPEADGPTHPGRQKRLVAVKSGWTDSCLQQQQDCSGDMVVAGLQTREQEPQSTAQSQPVEMQLPADAVTTAAIPAPGATGKAPMPDIPKGTEIAIPDLSKLKGGRVAAQKPAAVDRIPTLMAAATPSKFDRFVYDEMGMFDPDVRAKLQRIAFQFAAAANVEIVTFVVRDLKGRSADQFALDAMRQLRVGKMDVGNGAVLVVAPEQKEVGVALGPGLLVQYNDVNALKGPLGGFLKVIEGGGKPQAASSLIANAGYRIMRDTRDFEWAVRFNSLDELQAAEAKEQAERQASGASFDPANSPTFRKLVRLDATIISKAPDKGDRALMVNEPRSRHVGPAMHVRTADGRDAVLYVNANVPHLMPSALEEGKRYAFIVRDTFLRTGAPQMDLVSYDLLE